MIDFILTSKCSNKLHAAEPSSETFSDIAKLLTVVEPDEKMTVRTGKQQSTDRLLSVVLVKCRRISQSLIGGKSKPDQLLIKHLKCSSCVRIALQNIYERMTRKGQINDELKGLNSQLLQEIEKDLIETIEKEIKLFRKGRQYHRTRNALLSDLELYKKSLKQDLQNLEFL